MATIITEETGKDPNDYIDCMVKVTNTDINPLDTIVSFQLAN